MMKPSVGDPAPGFTAPVVEDAKDTVTLADLLGQRVVLVFYPKDNTPGCTLQACAMRDGWEELTDKAKIFGVSPDDEKSHGKFIAKHQLPYPLIVDAQKEIATAYGVWVKKSMYGKTYMGTERTTFLIGVDGRIEDVLVKVAPKEHFALLRKALA